MEKLVKKGKVYIAGAGCGDFELMTVKLRSLIESAECIIYDRLVNKEVLKLAPLDAELIYLGKEDCEGGLLQDKINATLIEKAKEGKNVLRLKGGHPFVFGRGGEEAIELVKEDIKFEIIPGVTSAISVPAYAGIPVSHRGINTSFHIFTGHTKQDGKYIDFETVAKLDGTLVFLMGVKNISKISMGLIDNGKSKSTPVAVIENGSTCHQRTVVGTLETIEQIVLENNVKSPSIIIVGDVVNLREQLSWFENKVLHGQKVFLTSEESQSESLSKMIRSLGGESMEFPFFKMDSIEFDIPDLKEFDTLVFTSSKSVHAFFKKIEDLRALSHLKICVAGEKTHDTLKKYKIIADVVSSSYQTNRVLTEALEATKKDGSTLLVTSKKVNIDEKQFPNKISQLQTYEANRIFRDNKVLREAIDESSIIAFPNGCTIDLLLDIVGSDITLFNNKSIIAANETIANKLNLLGINVDVVADDAITEENFEECVIKKGKTNNDLDYRGNKGFTHPSRKIS